MESIMPLVMSFPVGNLSTSKIRNILGVSRLNASNIYPTIGNSCLKHSKTWPYKGSYKSYPKYHNDAYINSYAEITPDKITIKGAHRETITRIVPSGFYFAGDETGIKVVRKSDGMEYHPTETEWFGPKFATTIRASLTKNFLARRKARSEDKKTAKANRWNARERARIDKIFVANLHTTRVTMEDSRRAGNCVEGALSFAERRLKIPRTEIINNSHLFSVSGSMLLANAGELKGRAEAAVRIAFARETIVQI